MKWTIAVALVLAVLNEYHAEMMHDDEMGDDWSCDSDTWNLTEIDWSYYNQSEIKCLYDCGEIEAMRAGLTEKETFELECHWKALKGLHENIMEVESLDMCQEGNSEDYEARFQPSLTPICKFHKGADFTAFRTCLAACPDSEAKDGAMVFLEEASELEVCGSDCTDVLANIKGVVDCTCPTFGPAKTKLDGKPSDSEVTTICGDFLTGFMCAKPKVMDCPYLVKAALKYFEQPKMVAKDKCKDTYDKLDDYLDELEGDDDDHAGMAAASTVVVLLAASLATLL